MRIAKTLVAASFLATLACSERTTESPVVATPAGTAGTTALAGETCAAATRESGPLPYSTSSSTVGATDDYFIGAEPNDCAVGGGVYSSSGVGGDMTFAIAVDITCDLGVTMDSVSGDMNLTALTDCADLDDSCLGFDDDAGSGGVEQVNFTAVAGTVYYLIVDGYSGAESVFDLSIFETSSVGCALIPDCPTAPDGTLCSDANPCTDNDQCSSGSCIGAPNDALLCDDGDPCTDDACSSGSCVLTPNTGNSCNDGDECTGVDGCVAGLCFGADLTTPLCDLCRATPLTESTLPFNLSSNTAGGTDDFNIYAAGECAGPGSDYSSTGMGPDHVYYFTVDMDCDLDLEVDPTSSDNLHLFVSTDCGDIAASCLAVDDSSSCCRENISISAIAGVDYYLVVDGYNGEFGPYDLTITEATAVGCALAQPSCDGTNDGQLCDDDNPCTETDTCTGGSCVGTANDTLGCEEGDPCTDNVCIAGVCQLSNNTAACVDIDGNSCTTGLCAAGVCVPTNDDTPSCDEANPCTDDACSSGSCIGTPNDNNFCTDDDPCTVDACASGSCTSVARDCSAFDGGCTVGFCNPVTGFCESQSGNEGGGCDDSDPCTENDVCTAGTCAGTPLDCSSLDDGICQIGVCNPSTAACEPATKDCSAADLPCNPAACNSGTGACEPAPGNDGSGCDDGDACSESDVCAAGSCAGTPRSCDTACRTATCEPSTGACINPTAQNEGGSCDDSNPCTDTDICTNSACIGTDNNAMSCDDGDACTTDACAGGICVGTALDCTTLDGECSRGVCNATSGLCESDAIREGADCDDADPCTKFDVCSTGVCAGAAKDCSLFSDGCNAGTCNAVTGYCEAVAMTDGTGCDDGDVCTGNDGCIDGVCSGTNICGGDDGGPLGDDDGGPGKSGGCNCSQQSPTEMMIAMLVLGLAPIRRRLRRIGARRQS